MQVLPTFRRSAYRVRNDDVRVRENKGGAVMAYGEYENRYETQTCPHCGKLRAYDWFVPESDACWKCRALRPELRENLKGTVKDTGESARKKLKEARKRGEKF